MLCRQCLISTLETWARVPFSCFKSWKLFPSNIGVTLLDLTFTGPKKNDGEYYEKGLGRYSVQLIAWDIATAGKENYTLSTRKVTYISVLVRTMNIVTHGSWHVHLWQLLGMGQ